jgi:uncharacterized OsmC-like protein
MARDREGVVISRTQKELSMHATAEWVGGDLLKLATRGKEFFTDQKPEEPADPSPVDYFVAAYAGCVGYFASKILRRKGIEPKGLKVEVKGFFAEEPHRIGSLEVAVTIPSQVSAELHELVKRSAETCTIHHTLQHPPSITFSYR